MQINIRIPKYIYKRKLGTKQLAESRIQGNFNFQNEEENYSVKQ